VKGESDVQLLIRFSRLVSQANARAEVLSLLVTSAVGLVGADAAIACAVEGDTLKPVASHGLPAVTAADCELDADTMGDELADRVLEKVGKGFHHAKAVPLASGRGLFGSLVILFKGHDEPPTEKLELAAALADLTASTLEKDAQYAELERSFAELRASREVMARTYKLRALGEMAAGISHDLKNILNPLSLHAQLVQRALPKDNADAHQSIAEMRKVLHRGVEMLNRLREFSRQAPEAKAETVPLNTVVHEAIEICRPRLHARHDLHVELEEKPGSPPDVVVRSAELVAALVNLIVNAIDAIGGAEGPARGTIVVETGASERGGWIRVSDDGPGMPPEVERRIFEPFFTTKGVEGTGLGLALVYAFVQRHNGTLEVVTAPRKGASFTLTFPRPAA
jgi:signal transduction histidine kinase